MPQPTFVSGGDPDYTKLTVDNTTKWTGAAGYGWNEGSGAEVSYEIALAKNTDPNSGMGEINSQWVLLSFMSQQPMPQIDGTGSVRIGFDYPYQVAPLDETVSQIILFTWDKADPLHPWKPKPPACSTGAAICANDPAADPSTWKSFTPPKIQVLQKVTPKGQPDGDSQTWPTDMSWIQSHSVAWIWGVTDNTKMPPVTKYYWRVNVALPIRTTQNNPSLAAGTWTSPSIYLDPGTLQASGKTFPGFWAEMVTDSTDINPGTGLPNMQIHHFPDWPVGTNENRDSSNVPQKSIWGQAEAGSPRDVMLLQPSELQCKGQGMLIEGTSGDNHIWHSAIWNHIDPKGMNIGNTSSLWDAAGTLYMYDVTNAKPAHNNMSVLLDNLGGGKVCSADADCGVAPNAKCDKAPMATSGYCEVNASDVHAQFLIAPYGSQAIGTIWSPLNTAFNDYTCINGTGGATCTPLPTVAPPIDSTPVTSGLIPQGTTAQQWNMASDWIPSPNYACAVQTNDNPGSLNWYYKMLGTGTGQFCNGAVYQPTDMTGMAGSPIGIGAGLPGHQCMQVSLSGNGVQVATKSAFRNMHQAPASLYREIATIDTRGLPKIPNQSYHYIYLYLETFNMPYRVDAGYAPKNGNDTQAMYTAMNQKCAPCAGCLNGDGTCVAGTSNTECGQGGNQCVACQQGQFCGDNGTCQSIPISSPVQIASRTVAAPVRTSSVVASPECQGFNPNVPAPSEDFITKIMPTMIVHAYADTGVTEMINGKKIPILTPMTSFGQFIHHDSTTEGNVFGWNANLEPFGNTPFQKVGLDTYRIRIPNDGAGQVVTHVEPLPAKRPTCSGTVNENIVALLKAIAPLITIDSEDAGEINSLIDSLQIECVDLQEALDKIDNGDWGMWQSWVHYLITQIEATDGCQCS